jgi:hypothetical protein
MEISFKSWQDTKTLEESTSQTKVNKFIDAQEKSKFQFETTHLVPYLDVASLTGNDKRLLALLHYRTASEPSD